MESFDGKLRDELLDREIFYALTEVLVLVKQYRQVYNVRSTTRSGPTTHWVTGFQHPRPSCLLARPRCSSD